MGHDQRSSGRPRPGDRILDQDGPSRAWAAAFTTFRLPPRAASQTARINFDGATNLVGGWISRPAEAAADEGPDPRTSLVPTGHSAGPENIQQTHQFMCTHLGGICKWNAAERTWDCPLHGSRFASDGTVVTAPRSVHFADRDPRLLAKPKGRIAPASVTRSAPFSADGGPPGPPHDVRPGRSPHWVGPGLRTRTCMADSGIAQVAAPLAA